MKTVLHVQYDVSSHRINMFSRRMISMIVATLVCLACWILPAAKDDALAGRYSYLQLAAAVAATMVLLLLVVVGLCPKQKRRVAGFRLSALWLGIALGLIAWEMVALAWPVEPAADNPWYLSTGQAQIKDEYLPWVRPPHLHWTGSSRGNFAMSTNRPDPLARTITFQTDHQGFRNDRDVTEAEVVFIGDSFTEAGNVPIEETFVARVGAACGVEVRNLGIAGYAPPSELLVLKKFGLACRPRTVVWQIAELNDLRDSVFFSRWVQLGSPSVRPGFESDQESRFELWQRRSPTHRLFDALRRHRTWPVGGEFVDSAGQRHTLLFNLDAPESPIRHHGWRIVKLALADGASLLREHEIQLIVVLIPAKLRVMASSTDFYQGELVVNELPQPIHRVLPDGWDLKPQDRLAAALQLLCQQSEVPFIDATDRLTQDAQAGQLVYQPLDSHLSGRGHEIVARLIADVLDNTDPRE